MISLEAPSRQRFDPRKLSTGAVAGLAKNVMAHGAVDAKPTVPPKE